MFCSFKTSKQARHFSPKQWSQRKEWRIRPKTTDRKPVARKDWRIRSKTQLARKDWRITPPTRFRRNQTATGNRSAAAAHLADQGSPIPVPFTKFSCFKTSKRRFTPKDWQRPKEWRIRSKTRVAKEGSQK